MCSIGTPVRARVLADTCSDCRSFVSGARDRTLARCGANTGGTHVKTWRADSPAHGDQARHGRDPLFGVQRTADTGTDGRAHWHLVVCMPAPRGAIRGERGGPCCSLLGLAHVSHRSRTRVSTVTRLNRGGEFHMKVRYGLLLLCMWSRVGHAQSLPTLRGRSLAGAAVSLPIDLQGKIGIFVVGFSKQSGESGKVWGKAIKDT